MNYIRLIHQQLDKLLELRIDDFFMAWDMCCFKIGPYKFHVSSVCGFIHADLYYDTHSMRQMLELNNQGIIKLLIGSIIIDITFNDPYFTIHLDNGWVITTIPTRESIEHEVLCDDEYWRIINADDQHTVFEKKGLDLYIGNLESWDMIKQTFLEMAQNYEFPQLSDIEIYYESNDNHYVFVFINDTHESYLILIYRYYSGYFTICVDNDRIYDTRFDIQSLICDPEDIFDEFLDDEDDKDNETDEPTMFMCLVVDEGIIAWHIEVLDDIYHYDAKAHYPHRLP